MLCVHLLQLRDRMQFPKDEAHTNVALQPKAFISMSLTSVETWYSSIERQAQGILHGPGKCHHYFLVCDVSMITDYQI